MKLTEAEAHALAIRAIAKHAANEFMYWEDFPELDEASFELLSESVDVLAELLLAASKRHDESTGIDSAYLWDEAS